MDIYTRILVLLIIRYKNRGHKGGATFEKYRLDFQPIGKGATSLVEGPNLGAIFHFTYTVS
jgi:hypothetical protein